MAEERAPRGFTMESGERRRPFGTVMVIIMVINIFLFVKRIYQDYCRVVSIFIIKALFSSQLSLPFKTRDSRGISAVFFCFDL